MAITPLPWQGELYKALMSLEAELPNGLLIYGPGGIGTIELVIEYAKSLFCTQPEANGAACGHCKGCVMARANTHPDLRFIVSEAESLPRHIPFEAPSNAGKDRKIYREILIHQPRALTDFLNLAAHENDGRRIIIVYPADALRADAASVLLKSLEEPPARTSFILVADDIDRVLPTIRSRCRLLRAGAPTREQALAWLAQQGQADPESALSLVNGAVYRIKTQQAVLDDPDLDAKTREQLLQYCALSAPLREALLNRLMLGTRLRLDDLALKEGKSNVPVSAALPVLEQWGYDLLRVKSGLSAHYFSAYQAQLAQVAAAMNLEHIYAWCDNLKVLRKSVNHPLNAQLVIEQCLLSYRRLAAGQKPESLR